MRRGFHRARREFAHDPEPAGPAVMEVTCPHCRRRTNCVQRYHAPVVVSVIFLVAWSHETIEGCPGCVRDRLWQRLALSIPLSNLLFPVVATIILGKVLASHLTDDPRIPPEYHAWADLPPPLPTEVLGNDRGRGRRLLIALAVLIVAAGLMFLIIPRLI
jgi:hypothetical protein